MAVNKNFVVKNGLEVDTSGLVVDAINDKVGVGTTSPDWKLHVSGGTGNRGGIGATDITISGIATVGVANSDSGAFRVLGISTFQGDLDLLGSAGVSTVRWDASKDGLIFQDNATARFGTGEDLRIWHDGTNSYISDQGSGSLIIYGTGETLAVFTDDGSVQLYNNDTKVFETTGLGVTTYGDVVVSGVTTSARLRVTGISTFGHDTNFTGTNGSLAAPMAQWNHSDDALEFRDNAAVRVGTSSDLAIFHDGSSNWIRGGTAAQDINLYSHKDVNISVAGGENAILAKANGSVEAYYDNTKVFNTTPQGVNVVGVVTALRANVTGIATFSDKILVGTGITVDANTGNIAVAGILTVGGNLQVTGDITYDEVTGRNLNITGITTLADQVNFGTSGVGATIFANGNATISGILTAKEYVGVFTSAGGAGIGIGSTTAHVGYGVTYIDFKGPGVSTVYSSSVTGITTIYFQGGGGSSVGAAGTWQNDGAQGISTAKSVGINTVGVAVTALQGGEKGASSGIGQTFQGLYISNGMVVNDNQLNGNHYIGTAFGGIMAGPVTVNGVITVDGNWAVV